MSLPDYQGQRELDPQCSELDLRDRVTECRCHGCGETWEKSADIAACPDCGESVDDLKAADLYSETEVPV